MSSKVGEVLAKIRGVLAKNPDLKIAVLFGSYANGVVSTMSDLDLLVEGEFSEAKLLMDLAEVLRIPIERIDLIRAEHLPIKVLARALSRGIVVVCRDPELLGGLVEKVAMEYPEIMKSYALNLDYLLDPEDKVDEARLLDLLNNAHNRAKLLKRLLDEYDRESLKKDSILDSALRWNIYEAIQSMVDACTVVATSLKLGVAESYKDYVMALIKRDIMKEELGMTLVELISLRNRLVHRYRYVEAEELLHNAKRLADDTLPAFRQWIYAVIEKYRKR